MRRLLHALCVFVLALTLVAEGARAQDKKTSGKKLPSQEEMMKRWQEAMTPGEPHKLLEQFVGDWDAEARVWMNGPKGEPSISKGSAKYSMMLGGRYLRQEYSGQMMGQPMSGVGYTGYDNFRKKYTAFWIDDMSTGMSTMEGTMDSEGKTLTMRGKMDEPATGEKGKAVKYVFRIVDKDKHVFESYDVTSFGEKTPVMVITYTRK